MIPYSFYIISLATCNRVNKFYKLRNVGLYDLTVSLKKKKTHFQEAILLLFNVHIFNQAIIAGAFYTYHHSSSLLIL